MGQDGGFHILVFGVDGREQLVGLGLGNHGRAQSALGDVPGRENFAQARDALGVEESAALVRRTGNEHEQLAIACAT